MFHAFLPLSQLLFLPPSEDLLVWLHDAGNLPWICSNVISSHSKFMVRSPKLYLRFRTNCIVVVVAFEMLSKSRGGDGKRKTDFSNLYLLCLVHVAFPKTFTAGIALQTRAGTAKESSRVFWGKFVNTDLGLHKEHQQSCLCSDDMKWWSSLRRQESQTQYHRKQATFVLFNLISARISSFPTKQDPQTVTGRDGTGMMFHLELR